MPPKWRPLCCMLAIGVPAGNSVGQTVYLPAMPGAAGKPSCTELCNTEGAPPASMVELESGGNPSDQAAERPADP